MEWPNLIELFKLADFIECDALKHEFVRLIVAPMIGDSSVEIRFISLDDMSYLQASYDEENRELGSLDELNSMWRISFSTMSR